MPAKNKGVVSQGDATLARRTAIVEQFVQLVEQLPDGIDGDIADIIAPLLNAQTVEELNPDEKLPSSQTLVGRPVVITGAVKRPSDHESLTGYYLRCDGYLYPGGDEMTFTVGGEQAMVVIAQLYTLKALPVQVEFVEVKTRSGNTAINCRVIERMPSRTIEG